MGGMLKQLVQFLCTASGCVIAQDKGFGVDFDRDWNRAKTGFTRSLKLALYGWIGFFGAQLFVDVLSPFMSAGSIRRALIVCAAGMLLCWGWLGVVAAVRIVVPALNGNAFLTSHHGISPTSSWFRAFLCRLPGCNTCMNTVRLNAMREARKRRVPTAERNQRPIPTIGSVNKGAYLEVRRGL